MIEEDVKNAWIVVPKYYTEVRNDLICILIAHVLALIAFTYFYYRFHMGLGFLKFAIAGTVIMFPVFTWFHFKTSSHYPPKAFRVNRDRIDFVFKGNTVESYSLEDIVAYYYKFIPSKWLGFSLYVKRPKKGPTRRINLNYMDRDLQYIILDFLKRNKVKHLNKPL